MSEKEAMLQNKYAKLYRTNYSSNGGIFTPKRRRQLLGIQGRSGRNRPLNSPELSSFWYDVRETVKYGLVDLQLFVETSSEENINRVLTIQNLEPFLQAFLCQNRPVNLNDVSSKAKVAHILVQYGLGYLRSASEPYLRRKEGQEVDDALELTQQLMFNLLTDEEKHSVVWKEIIEKAKKGEG